MISCSVEKRGDAGYPGQIDSQRGGGRAGRGKYSQLSSLFFIVALGLQGVEAETPTISGYNCSKPKDLEIWEAADNLANLNTWDYFMKVAGNPIYKVYKDVGSAGGWIILIQWGVWLFQTLWRTWKAWRGSGINREKQDPEGFRSEAAQAALAELMGPGPDRSPEKKKKPKRKHQQQMRYTKRDGNESDECEYVQKL